jgi:tetratricopeptide (TPR) repeat protein/class 3 adenylate cyclase
LVNLGDSLTRQLGPWQGIEELNRQATPCFKDLFATIHNFHGSIVRFSGHIMLALFTGDNALALASAAALALLQMARHYPAINLRIGLGQGVILRHLMGEPAHGLHDLVAGSALNQALVALNQAKSGEITGAISDRPANPAPWPAQSWDDLPTPALWAWIPLQVRSLLAQKANLFGLEPREIIPFYVKAVGRAQDLESILPRIQSLLTSLDILLHQIDLVQGGIKLAAFVGAPRARIDDSNRGIEAALSIIKAGREGDELSSLHMGLSMGPLYAGLVGHPTRLFYAFFGNETRVAARLAEMAAPWEILVSSRVRWAAGNRYHFTRLERPTHQDLPDFMSIVRVEKARESPLLQVGGPFVNRRQELNQLESLMRDVWTGRRRVVVLTGEAGIGKSRLAEALLRRWRERGGQAFVGKAHVTTQQQAYSAWGEPLCQLLQLQGEEQDVASLKQTVAAVNPELLPRLPLLGDVLGLPLEETSLTRSLDPKLRQASTHALVADLLRTQSFPLVLLLEDVQWLDGPSWDLIAAVSRALEESSVFILLTARPIELSPAALAYLAALPVAEEITLAPFSVAEATGLARSKLGMVPLPLQLAKFLQEKGQGNPFFIEEILRTLVEEGFIQQHEGTISLLRPLGEVSLSSNIQDVMSARIDRLDEPTRLTLKVASVIGRTFAYHVLSEIHPVQAREHRALRHQLDQLRDLDLIVQERSSPGLTYAFKQTVIQDVAYNSLLPHQRRDLHRRAAWYYEENHPDHLEPHYPLLAHHYGCCGDEKLQVRYCTLAGNEASRRYANNEAITFYSEALETLTRRRSVLRGSSLEENSRQCWDLLLRRETILNLIGQRDRQQADIKTMLSLSQEIGSDERYLETMLRWAEFYRIIDEYGRAEEVLQQAIQLAQKIDAPLLEGRTRRILGTIARNRGHYQEGLQYYQQAWELFEASGDEQGLVHMLNPMGIAYYGLGAYREALAYLEQALEAHRETENYLGEVQSLSYIGLVYWDCAQYDQALGHLRQALTVARQIGSRYDEALLLHNIGDLYRYMGQHTRAIGHLQRAFRLSEQLSMPSVKGECLNNLGRAYLEQGYYEQAQKYLQQALQIRRALDEPGQVILDLSYLASAFLGQGETERALQHSQQALDLMHETEVAVDWEQQVHYNHYLVCQAVEQPEEARVALERAYKTMLDLADAMSEEGRRSFLEGVRINRLIARDWAQMQP